MSRSATPARFTAASTRAIRWALSVRAAAAVAPWLTTPARIVAISGVRVVRPSAEMSRTVPAAGTSGSTVVGAGTLCASAAPGSSAAGASAAASRIFFIVVSL